MNNLITQIENVNIIICVTFHFNVKRLTYLKKILKEHTKFGKNVDVYVFTNTFNESEIFSIKSNSPNEKKTFYGGSYFFQIISCDNLKHPHNLILEHKKILYKSFLNQNKYTHFLHTEDDNLITANNIIYWLKYRKVLFDMKIIPSFFRYEFLDDNILKSTDIGFKLIKFLVPKLLIENIIFMNMPNPSQSNYLVDIDLACEIIENPNNRRKHFYFNFQGIREDADIGPIFSNVPKNYISRNFVPFIKKNKNFEILPECLINHIPANYALNNKSNLGKISIQNLFLKFPFFSSDLLRNIKYYPLVKIINLIISMFR